MSYDEFLEWEGESQYVEWVDGQVIPMPPITGAHNDVGNFLIKLFGAFLDYHNIGVLRTDPFQMKTGPDLPGRAPDLLFVARRNLRRLHAKFLEGPADLVVEIISPGSETIDRLHKFREYERGGVREYWLINPAQRTVEFYRRGRDGRFHLVSVGGDGVFRSIAMKGFWLNVKWLWDCPPIGAVLGEWGIA
jgi:Uma2 family endonuclease